jgi:hypothetical protein
VRDAVAPARCHYCQATLRMNSRKHSRRVHRERELRGELHSAAADMFSQFAEEKTMSYDAPDPYEAGLKQLRAASGDDAHDTFESQYKASRRREFDETRRALDANPALPLSLKAGEETDLTGFTPPDPYAEPLRRMREN